MAQRRAIDNAAKGPEAARSKVVFKMRISADAMVGSIDFGPKKSEARSVPVRLAHQGGCVFVSADVGGGERRHLRQNRAVPALFFHQRTRPAAALGKFKGRAGMGRHV